MAMFSSNPPPDFAPMQAASGSLADKVMQMRQQGMSNNQIIQTLISQGNSYPDVFNAMSQADMMGTQASAGSPMPMQPQMTGGPIPQGMPPMQMPSQQQDSNREKIEEIAEAIIEEKWDELVKNMNKVVEWKNKTETKIVQMEQKMKDIEANFDELHRAILGKVDQYDKNIQDVGTELKAMGKVFEKVLPTLTENVNELSRLSQEAKRRK